MVLKRISPRLWIVIVLLVAESGICLWQHLGSTRYFAWAPNDYLVTYDLRVSVGGHPLTADQVSHRYRLTLADRLSAGMKRKLGLLASEHYVFEDPPQHLINRIRWYESDHPSAQPASVSLTYQLDGGPVKRWSWPA